MSRLIQDLRKDLQKLANPEKASILKKFFKTGPGEYGEGDQFLGIPVPETRKIAKKYIDVSFEEIKKLLSSVIHEERLVAILLLVQKFNTASNAEKEEIVKHYLDSAKLINNWDLVDLSAPYILGLFYAEKKNRSPLYKLARSSNVWERRMSITATNAFIRKNQFDDTLKISETLLYDKNDLIHKAVGWMLREIGKRNLEREEDFLKKNLKIMPRTMLRYAVEKFPEKKRQSYLKGT